ncbi:hypothetical protein [Streptomyces sp. NPDC058249]|uniref:hypothetical protein n=1 Tax=Streptomyces sp. NPDC058249 TaxID=3346403 RepID=UPI0036EF10F1
MDEGLAAVISAGITGVVAIATARSGAKALRQQVLDQASVEHTHWLRERKASASASLIDGCLKCRDLMVTWYIKASNDPMPPWDEEERTRRGATIVILHIAAIREAVGLDTCMDKVRSARAQLSLTDGAVTEAVDEVIAVLDDLLQLYQAGVEYTLLHRHGIVYGQRTTLDDRERQALPSSMKGCGSSRRSCGASSPLRRRRGGGKPTCKGPHQCGRRKTLYPGEPHSRGPRQRASQRGTPSHAQYGAAR